jgi:hypothetical protein
MASTLTFTISPQFGQNRTGASERRWLKLGQRGMFISSIVRRRPPFVNDEPLPKVGYEELSPRPLAKAEVCAGRAPWFLRPFGILSL